MSLSLLIASAAAAASFHVPPAPVEGAVLHELNRARERPAEVAADLRRYRRTLRGLVAHGPDAPMLTREGAAAVDEAIAFLERQPPLPPVAGSPLLGRAARMLMDEQARTGAVGHRSGLGGGPGARARAAGGGEAVGETIAYGHRDAAAVVQQLIVDDGVADRGHRTLLFAPEFRYAGVGCASHPHYRHACTIDLSATHDGRRAPVAYASR